MPTSLATSVLLTTSGALSVGKSMLMPRQRLLSKTLLTIVGAELLMKATAPLVIWLSQLMFLKIFRSMTGDAPLPSMAVPLELRRRLLFSKIFLDIELPEPLTSMPGPKPVRPRVVKSVMVKPSIEPPGPMATTGPQPNALSVVCCAPLILCTFTSLPAKSRQPT